MYIVNTTQHVGTGLIIDPFGEDGAMRLVPVEGETPGRAFILDAEAVALLSDALNASHARDDA